MMNDCRLTVIWGIEKRQSPIRGAQDFMNLMDDFENAPDSISSNPKSGSNEVDESDSHREKHREPRKSTLRGITFDARESSFLYLNDFVVQ
jgi:hypothetical protein